MRPAEAVVEASMSNATDSPSTGDPYHLSRFVQAQQVNFAQALAEIRSGKKRTHWMWYVFPQIDGLAFSSTSKYYAIKSIEEARAYLAHPILGPRLLECAEAVVGVEGRSVFERLLDKYYRGERDRKTLGLLGIDPESGKVTHEVGDE
jgi:uncharacterized protein (DUF1810 family)